MNPNRQHLCNVWDWKMTYIFEHKHVCQSISLHSIAMLLTFVDRHDLINQSFRCIHKDEMNELNILDIPVQIYYGPRKPYMPSNEGNRSVLRLRVMAHQVVSLESAYQLDVEF